MAAFAGANVCCKARTALRQIAASEIRVVITLPLNAGPLSDRITAGRPRSEQIRSRARTIWLPPMLCSATTATGSCMASSTITRHLIVRPEAIRSSTKSIDHTSLADPGLSASSALSRLASDTSMPPNLLRQR